MIDFDRLIDNYLIREEKPRIIGKYYPSEIGYCIRKLWYSYKYPKEIEPELIKIFHAGDMLHEFVMNVIKSDKNPEIELLESELPFKMQIDGFEISGRIDDLVLLKENNKKVLVEVKSISRLIENPKPQHKLQLQLYMHATGIKNGIILYVEKNTLKTRVFTVDFDEDEVNTIINRFKFLHKHLLENNLPPAEAKMRIDMSGMCMQCEYRDMCDQGYK